MYARARPYACRLWVRVVLSSCPGTGAPSRATIVYQPPRAASKERAQKSASQRTWAIACSGSRSHAARKPSTVAGAGAAGFAAAQAAWRKARRSAHAARAGAGRRRGGLGSGWGIASPRSEPRAHAHRHADGERGLEPGVVGLVVLDRVDVGGARDRGVGVEAIAEIARGRHHGRQLEADRLQRR